MTWYQQGLLASCSSNILQRALEKAQSLKVYLKIAYQLDAFHRAIREDCALPFTKDFWEPRVRMLLGLESDK